MNIYELSTEELKAELLLLSLMGEEEAFNRHNELKSEMIAGIKEEISFREKEELEASEEYEEHINYLHRTTYTV